MDKPNFNVSKEFFCVVPFDSTSAAALESKVSGNGKKIKEGFFGNEAGTSVVFKCELDPTCQ